MIHLERTRRSRYTGVFLCNVMHETLGAPSSLKSAYLLSTVCLERRCSVVLGNTSLSTLWRKESENAKAFSDKKQEHKIPQLGRFRLPKNMGKSNCRLWGKVIDVEQAPDAPYIASPHPF